MDANIFQVINRNGIDVYTECFGQKENPAILLIMGATAQGLMWRSEFCKTLAEAGFFVIRYDHRDTGKSSKINYASSPYTFSDLAADCVAILDAYNIAKANIVGASMGSFITQYLAVYYPSRINKIALIMSSPNHQIFVDGFYKKNQQHELPFTHPMMMEFYNKILHIQPKDADEDLQLHKSIWQSLSNDHELIEQRIAEGKILKRLVNNKYTHNHSHALINSPSLESKLVKIQTPTLIIHGQEDYIIPIAHGKKLATIIDKSNFIEYNDMAHSFDSHHLKEIAKSLINFFR